METDEPKEELMEALSILYEDGKYSDLTIVCGESTYPVHKALLCTRSQFFAKACDGGFREARTGIIDLSEDDPQAVESMIHYFYHLDYPHIALHEPEVPKSATVSAQRAMPCGPFGTFETDANGLLTYKPYTTGGSDKVIPTELKATNLIIHAKVYALGELYAIEGLKAVALEKFVEEAKVHWKTEDFLEAAKVAYTSTPEHDCDLKDEVKMLFCQHRTELMLEPKVKDCLRDVPDLAFDVLMQWDFLDRYFPNQLG